MDQKDKEFKQFVYKTIDHTVTLTLFAWGNSYRVKYVITNNDPQNSRLLHDSDIYSDSYKAALQDFEAHCNQYPI